MKKYLLYVIVLLIFSILLSSCIRNPNKKNNSSISKDEGYSQSVDNGNTTSETSQTKENGDDVYADSSEYDITEFSKDESSDTDSSQTNNSSDSSSNTDNSSENSSSSQSNLLDKDLEDMNGFNPWN